MTRLAFLLFLVPLTGCDVGRKKDEPEKKDSGVAMTCPLDAASAQSQGWRQSQLSANNIPISSHTVFWGMGTAAMPLDSNVYCGYTTAPSDDWVTFFSVVLGRKCDPPSRDCSQGGQPAQRRCTIICR
jgi:hypothetical protein